jgi:DNA-binding MarR family transcriptional regulator
VAVKAPNGTAIRVMPPPSSRRRPAPARRVPAGVEPQVAAVRRFTRFFTSVIGVLEEGYLASAFTVTEARVLYELATRAEASAVDLVRDLGLDAGYVSRLLADFERRGLVARSPSPTDGRRTIVRLTTSGRAAFMPIDAAARERVAGLLTPLSAVDREEVVQAMARVEAVLTRSVTPARGLSARRGSGRSR